MILRVLFEKVAPWIKTDYARVGRSHKTFATDTGFMTSVLGWKPDEVFLNVDRSGKLMETFIFQELSAQIGLDNIYSLYQYRDREKREIDFIIEREDGALLGIEVKSSHNVSKEDFAHQIWFRDNLVKDKRKYEGIVLYSGEDTLSFGEGLQAVPIAALWQE